MSPSAPLGLLHCVCDSVWTALTHTLSVRLIIGLWITSNPISRTKAWSQFATSGPSHSARILWEMRRVSSPSASGAADTPPAAHSPRPYSPLNGEFRRDPQPQVQSQPWPWIWTNLMSALHPAQLNGRLNGRVWMCVSALDECVTPLCSTFHKGDRRTSVWKPATFISPWLNTHSSAGTTFRRTPSGFIHLL